MENPTQSNWEAANRGALVPNVAYYKYKNGMALTDNEQIFMWGYAHGHDEALARWGPSKDELRIFPDDRISGG